MALVKKIDISQDIINRVKAHLIAHYEYVDKTQFTDPASCDIGDLIAQLETGSISYPVASRIRMYLEFRNRYLQSTGDHSHAVRSQLIDINILIDQFGGY